VATYVPDASGNKFIPHVTVGVTLPKEAEKLRDEKFEAFTLSPTGAAVYHLGNFGTAREKLKSWELKSHAPQQLLPLVYDALRKLATQRMDQESSRNDCQPAGSAPMRRRGFHYSS
jgi:hypothetical protein